MDDIKTDDSTRELRGRPTFQVYASWPQRDWSPATPATEDYEQAKRWAAALLQSARRCGFRVVHDRDREGGRRHWRWTVRYPSRTEGGLSSIWVEHWGIVYQEAPDVAQARAMHGEHARFDRRLAIADGRL